MLDGLFAGGPIYEPWIAGLHEDDESTTEFNAIRAVAASYFGKMHYQPGIVTKGLVYYGKALQFLNRDLQDEETARSTLVLRNAMALNTYEV